MARYTFTLTLGSLTVTLSPPPDQFQRSIVQDSQLTLQGFSPNGTPRYTGEAAANWSRRYQWAVVTPATELQALILETMLREQAPGSLIVLKDEYEYVEPQVVQEKTLVSGSSITIATTRTTGFFQGNVWMSVDGDYKNHIGSIVCDPTTSQTYKEISFSLTEIP
jgi:hypothetical protein